MSGRGQLSALERLGDDYDDLVMWAAGELKSRTQLQVDILAELNRRLRSRAEEIGDDLTRLAPARAGEDWPISKSAFNRYSSRLAVTARRLEATREISRVLTERLQPGDTDATTVALAELLKTAVFEGLGEGEAVGFMDLKFAGDALKSAVAAQKTSADLRDKLETAKRRAEVEAAARAEKALDTAVKTRGLTAETAEKIKAEILGIRA